MLSEEKLLVSSRLEEACPDFESILENVWGPQRFLTFYVVCGLGAALCHMGVLYYEMQQTIRLFFQDAWETGRSVVTIQFRDQSLVQQINLNLTQLHLTALMQMPPFSHDKARHILLSVMILPYVYHTWGM